MTFKKNFLKRISLFAFLFLFCFSFFSFTSSALASDVLGTDFVSDDVNLSDKDPRTMAAGIINIVLSILGIIAVSIVIYGGFIWMNSEGNEERVQKAKDILKAGVIGLAIILSAWGISAFVLERLSSSTGIVNNVCEDGDTKPCGRGGVSTCVDGSWGPCIGSDCSEGEEGSWCSSALGTVCAPDDSLCNDGYICDNSCVCVSENDPENISELGEICDSTDGDGEAGVCATTKICNPNHALTCEDCECVGSPVITGFSPVGGFCQENVNEVCEEDGDCASGVCNKVDPNSSAGNFLTIFGYNFSDTYIEASSTVKFINANDEAIEFEGVPPSVVNSNCGDTWSNTQIIISFPEGFNVSDEVFVEITTYEGKTDRSNDNIGPNLNNIIVNNIKRPGLCRINPIEARVNQDVLYYGVNLLENKAYFGNQTNNIAAFTPNLFEDNFEGTVIVPGLNDGDTSTFTKKESEGVSSNFLDFNKLPEPPKGPSISFFEPTIGRAGQYVTIYGSGFEDVQDVSEISFYNGTDDIAADFSFPMVCMHSVWKDDQVIVKVPEDINYDDPEYQIRVKIGTWDSVLSDDIFIASSTADLLPSLCKMSPTFGPAGVTNVSFWGEYFKEDGQSTRAVFNINKESGDLAVGGEVGAQKVSTLVPEGSVTGPARISRGGLEGNGINFTVGVCSRDSDCPGSNICCGPNTNFPGSCEVNIADCFEDNKTSSVFEWDFISGFNSDVTDDDDDDIYSCNFYNYCPESYVCPNSPGNCSNYDGSKLEESGVCSSDCSSFDFCGENGDDCEYLPGKDKCVLKDSSCTEEFSYSFEVNKGLFEEYNKVATCKSYDIDGVGERSFYEISVNTTCPNIDGTQWTMIYPGKCVNVNSLEDASTCDPCPSGSTCSEGVCLSSRLCSEDYSCEGDVCVREGSASCDCCCDIRENEGIGGPNPACCTPLTCSYTCGISNNEGATNDDYGWCSGCNIGDDTAVNDAACNCFDTSGKYCEISGDYPDGICVDCTSLSEDACKEHSSTCCFDAVNDVCRAGVGDESVWGSYEGESGVFTDLRDGQEYDWVKIEDQIWMAENLKYDNGCSSVAWVNSFDEGWCGYYDNDEVAYGDYGMLYQWSAAMNGATTEGAQGICPSGWHIPTQSEWLEMIVSIPVDWGTSAKVSSSNVPAWNGDNISGFSALPSGIRADFNGNFLSIGSLASFWTSTSHAFDPYSRYTSLDDSSEFNSGSLYNHAYGVSVRCIKDSIAVENLGLCPYYNCDSEFLTVCDTANPQPDGLYKDIPTCDNKCAANCGQFTSFESCSSESNCCWDIGADGGPVCSAGNRFEEGGNAGYCMRYDCAAEGSVCDYQYPNLTGEYLNLNVCHKECAERESGFGESCANEDGISCVDNCNPFTCLDESGVMGTTPSCGFCCCDPNAAEDVCAPINEKLSCYKNIDSCSGDNRGLCCGCEEDLDCTKAGMVPSEVGCASDTCCKARPEVTGTNPENNQDDICHNASIEVDFSKRMNVTTFSGNVLLLEESDGPCSSGTYFISRNGKESFIDKIKNIFKRSISFVANKIYGREVLATASSDKTYCSVLGVTDFRNNPNDTTSLVFKPNTLLKPNTKYFFVVRGDKDLDSNSGILDKDNIGLNGKGYNDGATWYEGSHSLMRFNNINFDNSHIISFETMEEPADQGGICEVEKVVISPSSYLFQRNDNDLQEIDNDSTHASFDSIGDSDKAFYAYAFSNDDQILRSVAGYSWTWDWSISRNDVLEFKDGVVNWDEDGGDKRLISVREGVGDSHDFVKAEVVMDSDNVTTVGDGTFGRSEVYVFVCRNPWPAVDSEGNWYPWRDVDTYGNYNYEFYYCRDSGSDLTSDDLPAFLSNMAITKGPSPIKICSNEPSKSCSDNSECSGTGVCISSFLKETYFFKEAMPRFIEDVVVSDLGIGGALEINWESEAALVDSYKIYYRERGTDVFDEKILDDLDDDENCTEVGDRNICSYNLENLLNNVSYEIRITALSSNMAETELSSSYYGTPTDSNYASPPTNVSFEILSYENKVVRITWDAPVDYEVDSYRVYRGVTPGVYGDNFLTEDNSTEIDVSLEGTENNTFYFVVRSVNPIGIESNYSNEIKVVFDQFISEPSGVFIDERDGEDYDWVRIGDQIWMAENLAYDNGCSSNTWVSSSDENWCGYYDNDEVTYNDYGMLYQWSVAMNGTTTEGAQGICPSGWHVPTKSEIESLLSYSGGASVAGEKLKASSSDNPSWNGTNDYNFNLLPSGSRSYYEEQFSGFSSSTFLWSSTIFHDPSVWAYYFNTDDADVIGSYPSPNSAFSVRCIKD